MNVDPFSLPLHQYTHTYTSLILPAVRTRFRLGRPGSVEVTHPSNPDDSQSTRSAPSSVSGQDPDPAVSNPGVSAVTGSQESGTGSVSTATQQEQEKKCLFLYSIFKNAC